MHIRWKSFLSILIVMSLLLSVLPMAARAELGKVTGIHAESPNFKTADANGESLQIQNLVDGDPTTRAIIMHSVDLKDKILILQYPVAVTGLEIFSGDGTNNYGGDRFNTICGIYLSVDGQTWGERAAQLDSNAIIEDSDYRTHRITFENPMGATYVKLIFEENDPTGWSRVGEIYGLTEASVPDIPQGELELNANIAPQARATASSVEVSQFGAAQAIDGDTGTRWSSTGVDAQNQWLRLDFGAYRRFNTVTIDWESACGKEYTVDVSDNGLDWETVAAVMDGQPDERRCLTFPEQNHRYLRVHITKRGGSWDGASIYELGVYCMEWDRVREDAIRQLSAGIPEILTENTVLPTRSAYEVQISWDGGEFVTVENGHVRITPPATTRTVSLRATLSWQGNTAEHVLQTTVLSQKDMDSTYEIYPVPQHMTMQYGVYADLQNAVVYLESGISAGTKARLEEILKENQVSYRFTEDYGQCNLALGIHGSGLAVDGASAGYGTQLFAPGPEKFDIYYLHIGRERTVILGQHDNAVYYGLATLQQAMEQQGAAQLATADFEDYANKEYRGLIEGFYGKVYSVEDIISLLDYMERYKMNTFIYGPKGDPFHLGNWRDPYPETVTDEQRQYGQLTRDDMQRCATHAAENRVSFVWSIHPAMQNGVDFSSPETAEQSVPAIMAKFDHMYQLGVRQFGLFVDDIDTQTAYRGSEGQAYLIDRLQTLLEEKYNGSADSADHVGKTFYVPTYYYFFGDEAERNHNLGCLRDIHENVIVTFTGAGCWSNVENDSFRRFSEIIGRKPAMWWNFPVNDDGHNKIYMLPLDTHYRVDTDVTMCQGVLSNPMNEAEASKISLFGLADYDWNMRDFDADQNWEHAICSYSDDPVFNEALRVFAKNSDLHYDFTGIDVLYDSYRADGSSVQQIRAEMQKIITACDTLMGCREQVRLIPEIAPWILRLRDMAKIIDLSLEVLHEPGGFLKYDTLKAMYRNISNNKMYFNPGMGGYGTNQAPESYLAKPAGKFTEPFMHEIFALAEERFGPIPPEKIQGTHAQSSDIRAELNGEYLYIDNLVDGNPATRANITHTGDLKGKTLMLQYPEAVTGLEIFSGNGDSAYGGDKLAAPVAVYLSADGEHWGEPVARIDTTAIEKDGEYRTHRVRFPNPTGATYVKLVFLENDTSGWSRIGEIWGLKDNPEMVNIAGANMTLGNTLSMNFMVRKADAGDPADLSIQIVKNFADKREPVVVTVPAESWISYNEYYKVTFDDISAKEMTDEITAVILRDGKPTGDVYTDSVESYALRILRKEATKAELKSVIVDMLNYGAEAQKYFKYHQDVLANAQLTDAEKALASAPVVVENVQIKGENYFGANLNLGSNMALTLYFKNITPDMHAVVSYTKHTGGKMELTVNGTDFVKYNDTVYGIRANTLVVADAKQPLTVTVYDAENHVVASGTDSIASYVARSTTVGELGQSILKFAASAEIYFSNR